jgi:hypothetical protein
MRIKIKEINSRYSPDILLRMLIFDIIWKRY